MPLILLPAVDVVEGRAVRLVQGKAGSQTEYGSAVDAALGWQRDGAEWIHLVDLDAAFGREHAHLAGERRGNQDQRDRDGLVQIQFCRWRRPIPAGLSSCREIEREQPSKEH